MIGLNGNFGPVDYLKIFFFCLIITTIWSMLIYPIIKDFMSQYYLQFWLIMFVAYSITLSYVATINTSSQQKISKWKIYIIMPLMLLIGYLVLFPYYLNFDGEVSVPNEVKFLAEIFFYEGLSSIAPWMPTIVKYWFIYSFLLSFFITLVAVLTEKKKTFVSYASRGMG